MEKSPIRQLFDALIEHESLTVTFQSVKDMSTSKIRLHQLRKETDSQLQAIGEDSIFGSKSICFKHLEELTYQIYLEDINAATRSRFKIISLGATNNEDLSADMGEFKTA